MRRQSAKRLMETPRRRTVRFWPLASPILLAPPPRRPVQRRRTSPDQSVQRKGPQTPTTLQRRQHQQRIRNVQSEWRLPPAEQQTVVMETISFSLVMFLNQDSPIVKSLSPGGTESPPFHISTVWGGLLRRLLPTCPGGGLEEELQSVVRLLGKTVKLLRQMFFPSEDRTSLNLFCIVQCLRNQEEHSQTFELQRKEDLRFQSFSYHAAKLTRHLE
ncbi:hypothetical protein FQA47_008631 [Oryzias melastigma]|uniref:Uncharacterized protein n=1 Tax=Oryzias melastigma TaxID=30732 RepID=A0A834F315_ORYME|nr:hypothetical protein FQA47_008631 [Oryzias melastigma]